MKLINSTLLLTLFLRIPMAWAGSVNILWDANSEPDLQGYRIHYGKVSLEYTETIDVGNVLSYRVHELQVGVTYYFAITAYDFSGNESPHSQVVSAKADSSDRTTDLVPPDLVSVVAMGPTQIDLRFSEPIDEASAENVGHYRLTSDITASRRAFKSSAAF